jgi:multidrug efflux pump subunit AcrA (membrane-fusion protein)
MTAEVNIIVEQRENALLVPATAVIDRQIWTVRDGRLHRQSVATGVASEAKIEIISGLAETDIVVVRPVNGLKEGRRARISP